MISSLIPALIAYRDRSVARFWAVVTAERVLVTVLSGIVVSSVFNMADRTDLEAYSDLQLVVMVVGVAPIIETLIFQSLPCAVAKACSWSFTTQVMLCWLPFAFAHLPSGSGTFICAGMVSGFYLAVTYVRLRTRSFLTAFSLTCASHALLNAFAVIAILQQRYSHD